MLFPVWSNLANATSTWWPKRKRCLNSHFIETFGIFLLLALLSGSYRFSGTPAKCNMKAQIPSHSKSHDTWSYQRRIILANLPHQPIITYVDYHIVNIFTVWSLFFFLTILWEMSSKYNFLLGVCSTCAASRSSTPICFVAVILCEHVCLTCLSPPLLWPPRLHSCPCSWIASL